ncbi:hypothetical protein ['Chrysanthemum coronarium' phytoplasma]|uniref:Uncharacterized conserved protein n=1 Tax='Chrysanthemum coronarium' phytoplasma TaxID=1520703 RepID=A0ABQ0J3Q9_9MOLU|nr:hypothetical protein ['Chrysanthemum coronarium' phytoplasma]GAK74209.1 uncharacterized conserved protein ['Chrysanthemum coronarium' phytoplasma]
MQIFNLTTNQLIDKLIAFVTYIITFLKTTFNNIIAIKDCSFDNLLNSTGIIISFVLSIFYILVFITLLCFLGSIFNIIKKLIKYTIYYPIKYFLLGIYYFFYLIFKLFIKSQPPVEPIVQPVKSNNDLINLQRKINNLEYKLNLQKKQNVIKPFENKYQKRG